METKTEGSCTTNTQERKILILKAKKPQVSWEKDVINNEDMGKKSSKSNVF